MQEAPAPSRWKSPWLWIGLSCGVLILGFASFVGLVIYSVQKTYREVEQRRNPPVLGVAESLARKNPDVVVVLRGTKSHMVALRNRRTRELFILRQEEGNRLRIRTPAGVVRLDAALDRRGELRLGSASGPAPAWVPVLPGTQPRPLYALRLQGVDSGCFLVAGPPQRVLTSYQEALARGGFKVIPTGDFVSATSPDSYRNVYLSPASAPDRPSGVLLTWSQLNRESLNGPPG